MSASQILRRGRESIALLSSRQLREEIKRVRASGLYDEEFYTDLARLPRRRSNILHFLQEGWRRGLSPSRFFDTGFYLTRYEDIRRAGINPLIHYLDYGWKEGRWPNPFFDPTNYKSQHLGGMAADQEPLAHAIRNNPGLLSSHLTTPFIPRLAASDDEIEVVRWCPFFDQDYYRSMYPDVAPVEKDLAKHYVEFGWKENRNPSAEFDTNFYVRSFPESIVDGRCPVLYHLNTGRQRNNPTRFPGAITLPIKSATTRDFSNLRVAVHVHAFFVDVFEEIVWALKNMPVPFHLFVTVVTESDKIFIENIIARMRCGKTSEVVVVPNRGRDIAPFLVSGRDLCSDYDFVCHIHTKKSLHTDFGDAWRHYLFDQLFGSAEIVSNIIGTFIDNPMIGILYPDNFYRIKKFSEWGLNAEAVIRFLAAFNINVSTVPLPEKFATGSMTWYRTAALRSLIDRRLEFELFEDERQQVDTTLAHVLERALPIIAEAAGYRNVPYYSEQRVRLNYGPIRHGAVRSGDASGLRWLRDTPLIAINRPVALKPLSSVFNEKALDLHWIIPDFGRGAGGHMTTLRMVELLGEFGHHQTIWIQNARNSSTPEIAKKRLQDWYRPIKDDVIVRFLPDDTRQLSGDIIIATDCWTAYPAASCSNFKARFYFIQDFEPQFHAMGENYLIAEQTYRMGFSAITAGDWLEAKAKSYGMWTRKWQLASDPDFYFPAAKNRSLPTDRPIRIAFYAREYTPRRAMRLGIAAMEELAKRQVNFKAYLYGEDNLKVSANFECELLGIQTPEQLGELYRTADIGLVFSTTNYSLVPLEMMACGLPVVEIDTESTRAVFKNDEVAFARPDPHAIADEIQKLSGSDELRSQQIRKADAFLQKCNWRDSARVIEAAFVERLHELDFKAIDPVKVCAPGLTSRSRASVVIPVLNGGALFERVLERLSKQTCEWPYDVLVIDNGSDDGTPDMVRRFSNKNVRLHEIPHSEFQHGRTRNLGIELTDGDFVALTTADAMPADEYWLQNLIGGFSRSDRVAGVFGRHKAYPEHGAFIVRDIDEMFDRYADYPEVYSMRSGLPSHIYRGGITWRMLMHYYSDNNSAMSRSVWKLLPYPDFDWGDNQWGEDQLWAWEMLKAGFEKVYIDNAIVYHSHDFSLAKTYQVALTEGKYFKNMFGYDLIPGDSAEQIIRELRLRDEGYALKMMLPRRQLEMQNKKTQMVIRGRSDGARSAAPPVWR